MVIERFPVSTGLATIDPNNGVIIADDFLPTDIANHLGGSLRFDRDATDASGQLHYLYAGFGDQSFGNNSCGSCPPNGGGDGLLAAQDNDSLIGKVVRYEVSVSQTGLAPSVIVGKGLRNPFGVHVDRGNASGFGAGMVWIVDTGDGLPGELNEFDGRGATGSCASGACVNFGWPLVEGDPGTEFLQRPATCDGICALPPGITAPVYTPATFPGADAVFSAIRYRGMLHPALRGRVMYGVVGVVGGDLFFSFDPSTGPVSSLDNHTGDLGMSVQGGQRNFFLVNFVEFVRPSTTERRLSSAREPATGLSSSWLPTRRIPTGMGRPPYSYEIV